MRVTGSLLERGALISEMATHFILKRIRRGHPENLPSLFILGLPRSGTTLVYQYIVHRTHVAYLTNGVGKFPGCPCTIVALQSFFNKPYFSDFQSKYGKVKGPMAPREAGAFWGNYFKLNSYQTFDDIPLQKINSLRETVRCIESIFNGAPFVNKNVKHMLRINALAKIFSESFFLVMERDFKDVGLSLLKARKAIFGDYSAWFSVKPRNYENIKNLDPSSQIAAQLKELWECMNEDFAKIESDRVYRLSYEQFCNHPDIFLEIIPRVFNDVRLKNGPVYSFYAHKETPSTDIEKRLIDKIDHLQL